MTSPRRQSSSATCPARCGSGSPCRRSTGRDDSRPRLAAGGRAGRRVRRVTQSPIGRRSRRCAAGAHGRHARAGEVVAVGAAAGHRHSQRQRRPADQRASAG